MSVALPEGAVLLVQKSDKVAVLFTTSEYKGVQYAGIREHLLKGDTWIPTKSGVNMPITMWPMLQKAIGELAAVKGSKKKSSKSTLEKLSEGDVLYFPLLQNQEKLPKRELQRIAEEVIALGACSEKRSRIPPQRGRILYKVTVEEGKTLKVRPHSDCSTTKPLTWEKR